MNTHITFIGSVYTVFYGRKRPRQRSFYCKIATSQHAEIFFANPNSVNFCLSIKYSEQMVCWIYKGFKGSFLTKKGKLKGKKSL